MARVRVRGRGAGSALILGLVMVSLASPGCGDEAPPTTPAGETAGRAAPPSPAAADAYELDVIAEAEPDEGPPPLTVQFLGYVEEDAGAPWRFHWDFGDGTTSIEQNPTHTYGTVGDYTATLTATDQSGQTGTDEIDVFVETDD